MEHRKRVRRHRDDELLALVQQERSPERSRPTGAAPASPGAFAAAPAAAQRALLSTVQRLAGNAAAGAALQRAPIPVVQGLWGPAQITAAKKAARKAVDDTDPSLKQYNHILARHGSASKAAGAGKFSDNKKIITWVFQALRNGTPSAGRNEGTYEFDLDIDGVGTNINGGAATAIRVVLAAGPRPFVVTAYPF